ncbi:M16 family metallopeptidase [Pedobacter sp.]|uniref:M16 family metallopeptidase n=1 Tax=Pedobacter sp. TaxID=1411316 RepID=UPI00396C6AD0
MLNRTQAPAFRQVNNIKFIPPVKQQLANGIDVFILNIGEQDLVRIEFIFENVNWDASKPLLAMAVNGLINSGTASLSAKEIADKIDYYGAFLQTDFSSDYTNVTLFTLTKHLNAVLPVVYDILNNSIFPQEELDIYKQNQKQRLQVNLQKNDFLGRKTFAHAIFGNTPYGINVEMADYDELKREELLTHYQSAYQPKNCVIIVSGKFVNKDFEVLDQIFGKSWKNEGPFEKNKLSFVAQDGQEIYVEKPDALQSAIRMGNLAIDRKHPDFPSLQVLNCVLGGYFGSRLMANIREDKGYTYGIGSAVASLKQAGYFFIATEVGADVCADALKEIEKEITLLKTEPISEEELDLVRNYMLGSMLGSLENAFSHADKFKNIYFSGMDYDYYSRYIDTVKTITPAQLMNIANKYLNSDQMIKVVIGKK